MASRLRTLQLVTMVLTFASLFLLTLPRAVDADSRMEAEKQRIEKLISQLGSEEFATRQRARAELERIGAPAFDSLYGARDSKDIEIRLQARYLLRAITVQWARPTDPPPVKKILENYQKSDTAKRRVSAKRLSALPDDQGLEALCRIVRFESSNDLSKRAAFWVIETTLPPGDGLRDARKDVIEKSVELSQRIGAQWLRTYLRYLDDPVSTLDDWDQHGKIEESQLKLRPSANQKSLVRDFVRWQIELLERLERRDQAIALMRRTIAVQISDHTDLAENLQWLRKREAWAAFDQIANDFDNLVKDNALLTYLVARSFKDRDQDKKAEELSKKAFDLSAKEGEQEPLVRLTVAEDLRTHEMRDWSESEFRHVMKSTDEKSIESFQARYSLASMMHDWGQNKEAAEIFNSIVKQFESDKKYAKTYQRSVPLVKGLYHFASGLHCHSTGDVEGEKQHLTKAYSFYPSNIDSLIAMYHVKTDDPKWKDATRRKIDNLRSRYDRDVREMEEDYQLEPAPEKKAYLAIEYNQYSWLVSSTYGDFELALERSKKSNELRPEYAGHLDTLGRCYFAAGDLDNAIFHQQSAAELEPYTGQIVRQLEQFQKIQLEQKKSIESTDSSK